MYLQNAQVKNHSSHQERNPSLKFLVFGTPTRLELRSPRLGPHSRNLKRVIPCKLQASTKKKDHLANPKEIYPSYSIDPRIRQSPHHQPTPRNVMNPRKEPPKTAAQIPVPGGILNIHKIYRQVNTSQPPPSVNPAIKRASKRVVAPPASKRIL